MPVMSTCLGRLGSRFSMIFDPHRHNVGYGALGLMRQEQAELVIGLDDGKGNYATLPLCAEGKRFHMLDQRQTMTSLVYEAHSLAHGVRFTTQIVAPFWPQDERTSTVPAYIVKFRIEKIPRVRWTSCDDVKRKGVLRFGLKLPIAKPKKAPDGLHYEYDVDVGGEITTGEGGMELDFAPHSRRVQVGGRAHDIITPLEGKWRVRKGMLEAPYSLLKHDAVEFTAAMIGYCGDALFERFGKPMKMKYAKAWKSAEDVAAFVGKNHESLCAKSAEFDDLWLDSSLPMSVQDLSALSFQSYLMNTLWCEGEKGQQWFSVWEGSCWYNSTVDVTYNEAMLYFACWPQLLELIFEQWSQHGTDADEDRSEIDDGDPPIPGLVLQHDMGSGWTANGQSYHHTMPVEENSNFLLMLYAHGKWWGREELYEDYADFCRDLADYLLWTDSTGNGFPDRGTANTIDDATPAVQYGRDNIYLGIKRLGALHAARRMFDAVGDAAYSRKCAAEVRRAVKSLNAGWLGDHWGVCLDKSAKGLVDCWSGKPLPYKTLPGWDAYSLYTTNGLLYLLMIDDLPAGISADRLREDVVNATRASMTRYGCGHSSMDKENMWVAMNVWRDCAAGYLGEDMLANSERYWAQQLFSNGPGSEKPNCFTETSLTNNLVWYPRNTAIFGLTMAMARLTRNCYDDGEFSISPFLTGRWPLLPLADWQKGDVPVAVVTRGKRGLEVEIE